MMAALYSPQGQARGNTVLKKLNTIREFVISHGSLHMGVPLMSHRKLNIMPRGEVKYIFLRSILTKGQTITKVRSR